ncbi:MAG: LrgB family protein [Gammaproteobacteria bacterium]|nr:LrgB family protein [Gammaproteobacteria bacterium]
MNWENGWSAVLQSPWLMVGMTVAGFHIGSKIYNAFNKTPVLHPVLIGLLVTIGCLVTLGISFQQYREGADMIYQLLGPVTVALAVPMYTRLAYIRKAAVAVSVGLLIGGGLAVISALAFMWLAGADAAMLATTSTKSVTGAIAMQVAEGIGGYGALAAVIVLVTGVAGAIVAPPVFKLLNIESEAAQGFALGVAAHAVGTARSFEISETAGAFAALGMSLMGIACAILIPLAASFF